jgi:small subunit ribosomal protein S16
MLVIRFLRTGKKNQPFFRIVVTDKKNPPRGGRFLEILGFFNPLTKEKKLNQERIKYWLSVGAQPSESLHNLLVAEGIIKAKKIAVHKKPKKKEEEPSAKGPEVEEKPKEETLPAKAKTQEEKKEEEPKEETEPQPDEKPEEKKEEEETKEKKEGPQEKESKEEAQEEIKEDSTS